jgi:hypothetical protein
MKAQNPEKTENDADRVENESLKALLDAASERMSQIKTLDFATRDLVSNDLNGLLMANNSAEENNALIEIGHKARVQPIYRKELQETNQEAATNAAAAYSAYNRRQFLDKNHKDTESQSSPGQQEPQENSISLNERKQEPPKQADLLENIEDNSGTSSSQNDKNRAEQINNQNIPDTVSSRYIRIEDKYYFPDKTVAFEDRGNKLKLGTENQEVIKDALAIAEARDWESISISGSQNFKHQVWREATIRGMDVSGYTPSELEVAELNHAQALRETRKGTDANRPQQAENTKQQQEGLIRGILLAHGADHYRHDPKQGQSYYIKLDVGNGKEITRWGADFKRAIADSRSLPQVGDAVVINNIGKQHVDIASTVLDAQGNPVEDKKTVTKNTWQVEKADYYNTIREQAEALRIGKEIERRVIADTPQLAEAIAVSRLGEKIAEQAKVTGALRSQEEVDAMVKHINTGLADALVKGKTIKTPEIQEHAKNAAITVNNVTNDHKPPELIKDPQTQEMGISR